MFWLIPLLISLVTLLVVFKARARETKQHKKLPPCPQTIPFIGNMHHLLKRNAPYIEFMNLSEELGKIFAFWFGSKLVTVISDYDAVKKLLHLREFSGRSKTHTASEFSRGYQGIITTSECPVLKKRVSIISKFLKEYNRNRLGGVLLDELRHFSTNIHEKLTSPYQTVILNLKEQINLMMVNITMRMLFGKRLSATDQDFHLILNMHENLKEAITLSNILEGFPIIRGLGLGNHFIGDYCNTRDTFIKRYLLQLKRDESTLAHHLLNCGQDVSRDETDVLLSDMLMAGIETVSCTLQYVFLYLIMHPAESEKCYREVDQLLQGSDLKLEDVGRFHYAHAFISETLRKSPAGPLAVPHCAIADVEVSGYIIPKGTSVLINIFAIHNDHKIHDQPGKFMPERFLDENGRYRKIPGFLPFSLGRRQCLGKQVAMAELLFLFIQLLQVFKFEDTGLEKLTDQSSTLAMMTPKDYSVRVSRRIIDDSKYFRSSDQIDGGNIACETIQ